MSAIKIILWKEWLELRQQRTMLLGTAGLVLLFTAMPIVVVYVTGRVPPGNGEALPDFAGSNTALAGLPPLELGQALVGQQFSILFLVLPMIIPSVIASYSIVGEKNSRTLEPVLATPISTWDLLLAKSLAALIPAVSITWFAGLIFVASMRLLALSDAVFNAIITPGWLIVFLLASPLMALITIGLTVAVSARVNDVRSAQQIAAVLVVPLMGFFYAQLAGVVVLNALTALLIALVLALAALVTIWFAVRVFQREAILTRWR